MNSGITNSSIRDSGSTASSQPGNDLLSGSGWSWEDVSIVGEENEHFFGNTDEEVMEEAHARAAVLVPGSPHPESGKRYT